MKLLWGQFSNSFSLRRYGSDGFPIPHVWCPLVSYRLPTNTYHGDWASFCSGFGWTEWSESWDPPSFWVHSCRHHFWYRIVAFANKLIHYFLYLRKANCPSWNHFVTQAVFLNNVWVGYQHISILSSMFWSFLRWLWTMNLPIIRAIVHN